LKWSWAHGQLAEPLQNTYRDQAKRHKTISVPPIQPTSPGFVKKGKFFWTDLN